MEKLYSVAKIVGLISVFSFAFSLSGDFAIWTWSSLAVLIVCMLISHVIEYKEGRGMFAPGVGKALRGLYIVSVVLVIAAVVMQIIDGPNIALIAVACLLILASTIGAQVKNRKG